MSNETPCEIPFNDRLRWARVSTNAILRHRMTRWAHDGGPLASETVALLCEELERLTEFERNAPRQPRFPSALWSERNAATERVVPFVPELAARLREWVADNYATEVDEILIGLADALVLTNKQLDDECEFYECALDDRKAERDSLREELAQTHRALDKVKDERDDLRRDLAEAWHQLARLQKQLAGHR